jgi:rhodanese-related sulfurtransferase
MKRNLSISILVWALIASCTGQKNNNLSPKDFKDRMTPDVTVLDVRTPGEFKSGHLDKAINIDIKSDQFEAKCGQLDKSKPVLVYCLGGGRSSRAGKMLRDKGFTVQELKGGIDAWQDEGFPVVK